MPEAILLGVPKQQSRRLQAALRQLASPVRARWTLHLVYSAQEDKVSITARTIAELLSRVQSCSSAHVLSFRPKTKQQQDETQSATRPYFRFRWADNSRLQLIPHNVSDFFTYLSQELEVEEEWAAHVQPADVRSPVILPEPSFIVQPTRQHMWTVAADAANSQQIRGAANAISTFRGTYWRTVNGGYGAWTDEVGNVFDHTGARHGIAPFPRCWKYSFGIPAGFHFDVTALSGRAFQVSDYAGRSHEETAGGHINVDAHGFVI